MTTHPTFARRNETFCRSTWAVALLAALLSGSTLTAEPAGQNAAGENAGENIALGAKYTLRPRPGYSYCTDSGDTTQLTDGETTTDYFWTQQGTVGWSGARYATVTVDLGKVEPIAGVSFTTAAGAAGVTWPAVIHVLASDDGKTYRNAGDLVALDHKVNGPWPESYAIRRLVTSELNARGQYVKFMMIPLPGGPYMFVDEVEVFRGSAEMLERQPAGQIVDVNQFYEQGRIRRSVQLRFSKDQEAIRQAVEDAAGVDESTRKRLLERLDEIRRQFQPDAIGADASFRAVLPLDREHARLFEVQAGLWNALGRGALTVWVPPTWDPVDLVAVPPASSSESIEVHTMQGEYRAAAFNLANSTDRPTKVRLRLEGLPESPTPGYVTLHEVQWTDTSQSEPVAAALPEAESDGKGWTVGVLPGLVRQVWLTFHVTGVPAGEYSGRIVVQPEGAEPLDVPIRLRVWPVEFPKQTTLWLGGWSYTNGGGSYGITPINRKAFIEHLQEHFVNAPWATSGVMRNFEFDRDNPSRVRLDTKAFDEWIALWPDAKKYLVFLSVAHYSGTIKSSFGGAEIGTPEFDRRVGTWISAWVDHLKSKGISADRLGLLIHDEPHEGSDIQALLAWARAIRAAQPEVLIWEDPTYRNPQKAPPELFEVCDVLCPNRPMWLDRGEPFERFYLDQKQKGRMLQFYSCSGPARLLDPYSYYRLQAWHAWGVGATGSYFWAFGDNSGSSSWNEYFVARGPFTPLFIDEKTVTAGKQMEAIRESVEDYEYFVMLREAVQRAKAAGRADAAVAKAESLLASAAQKVVNAEGAQGLRLRDPKDRTQADAVRVEILEALVSLE